MKVLCPGLKVASAQLLIWELAADIITSLEPDQRIIYTEGVF